MIAHSLPDVFFGPAQQMHGATYIVDVEFFNPSLNPQNVVIDIGRAHTDLKHVLQPLNYKNLDEHPDMKGDLTTTEYLARYIHAKIRDRTSDIFNGEICVTLGESHVAWASYRA